MKPWARSPSIKVGMKKNKNGLSASQVTQRLARELAAIDARTVEKRQDRLRRELDALLADCRISRADAHRVIADLPA